MKISTSRLFIFLLFSWFVLNFFQAIFTEINPDEAYYALYGKYLDWGYFDHPPLVALLCKVSSLFFQGNLGVRFLTVLLQIPTLILIWKQLENNTYSERQSVLVFFILSASLFLFVAYGFTTTPDVPLLFFSALLLFSYKRFLEKESWGYVVILSISMAGLVYSKYQGVLVIFFVLLSNIRLLIHPKFVTAAVLSILLCLPHFYWQYAHDFPSFKYHLIERSKPFNWGYFFEFIPNQLVTFNPFTLFGAGFILFKFKPSNRYERAHYFIIIGLLSFFWLTSFRGHVEPQWTVAASVPMIILLHNNFHRNDWLKKYILKFVTASLLLVFIARFVLVSNLLPSSLELSGKEARYRAIEKVAKDRPVVFTGSFQDPSLYTFFTGKPATVISSIFTRQTQFDIWHLESKWSDRPVFLYGVYADRSKSFTIDNYQIDGFPADGLQTANRLNMKFSISDDHFKKGDSTTIHATIQNPCKQDINLSSLIYPMKLQVIFFNKKGLTTTDVRLKNEIALLPQQISTPVYFDCTIPDIKEGDYTVGVGFATIFGCTLNSDLKKINIH